MTNRTVLGAFDGDYVLRVSRPGYNVLDPGLTREQLAFDSRWPENMNILAQGSATMAGTTSTVVHGGSYSTGAICFVWLDYGGYLYPLDAAFTKIGSGYYSLAVGSDRFTVTRGGAAPNATYYYVVLRNSNG